MPTAFVVRERVPSFRFELLVVPRSKGMVNPLQRQKRKQVAGISSKTHSRKLAA